MTGDRGRDVTPALTEVRTVLSRAESALRRSVFEPEADEDGPAMYAALEEVARLLAPWRKTGKPTKRCGHRALHARHCTRPPGHGGEHNEEGLA